MHLMVHDRRDEADGVVSLTLTRPDGEPLPAWEAGAHVDLVLDEGLVRQYSLCGDPRDPYRWRLGILREAAGRGGSEHAHTKLGAGDLVEVSAPRNHFALAPAARYLFVAGGIGITPILPMIAAAEQAGADWRLLYGGRTRRTMAFRDELTPYGDRVLVLPEDEHGLLPVAEVLAEVQPDTLVYACGPEPMLRAVETHVAHWPASTLHVERFAPKDVSAERTEPDGSFEVEFARSGLHAVVPPDRSVLAVAEALGVPADFSCGEGTCGTCETTLLEGRVEHRDSVLAPEEQAEQTCLMICVSRAERGCARLVLDL